MTRPEQLHCVALGQDARVRVTPIRFPDGTHAVRLTPGLAGVAWLVTSIYAMAVTEIERRTTHPHLYRKEAV